MIATWVLFVLTFLLGYLIGNKTLTKESISSLQKKAGSIIRTDRVGPVMRPTATKLEELRNPYIAGAKDAMREALKDIPELNT